MDDCKWIFLKLGQQHNRMKGKNMANKIFKEYWEEELSAQMLSSENQKRIRAYICSPLNAKTDYEMFNNMRSARGYMYYAWKEMNFTARAPHAYLPSLLCDRIQEER